MLHLDKNGLKDLAFSIFWVRQHGPLTHWYPTATLHDVTTQKTSSWISTAMNILLKLAKDSCTWEMWVILQSGKYSTSYNPWVLTHKYGKLCPHECQVHGCQLHSALLSLSKINSCFIILLYQFFICIQINAQYTKLQEDGNLGRMWENIFEEIEHFVLSDETPLYSCIIVPFHTVHRLYILKLVNSQLGLSSSCCLMGILISLKRKAVIWLSSLLYKSHL